MLSVDEALDVVLTHARQLAAETIDLEDVPVGYVLAESVVSDIDSPPHDKSIVDGYAVLAEDTTRLPVDLNVLEEVTAGMMPSRTVEPGTATRIMTGAPIPSGADAVVMVEQTQTIGDRVRILGPAAAKGGQNIMRCAASLHCGETVLQPGKALRPIECGLLAEFGHAQVRVIRRPRAAILATGNEIVSFDRMPGPGQIRNSNGLLLQSLAIQAGAIVHDKPQVAKDEKEELKDQILRWGLMHDVLIITGGVSAGVLDLVPQVLSELGVEQKFHKINLKPGKPLWFGVCRHSADEQTLVFGLPGNPVSSLVCFELFVRPAIQKLRGLSPTGLRRVTARLTNDHQQRGDRPTYWPSVLETAGVRPLSWKGSGDLRTLTEANCLAVFPAGERMFRAGDEVGVLQMDE